MNNNLVSKKIYKSTFICNTTYKISYLSALFRKYDNLQVYSGYLMDSKTAFLER